MARWVDIVTPAALNSKRASMRSIPVEWLAWFAELTLAVGPPTACKAGLTLSLGVKILQWLLYLIRQVSTPICVMASEILPCRLSASSTRHYSRAQRVIQRFQTRGFLEVSSKWLVDSQSKMFDASFRSGLAMACLAFALACGLDGKAAGKRAAWKGRCVTKSWSSQVAWYKTGEERLVYVH
jgi:hypothetical protein